MNENHEKSVDIALGILNRDAGWKANHGAMVIDLLLNLFT